MTLSKTPLYLKDENFVSRPTDSEYFLVADNGVFLCHNTKFFQADVRIWGSKLHWERPTKFYTDWGKQEEAKRIAIEEAAAKHIDSLQPHQEGVVKSLFPILKAKHVQKIVGFFNWVYKKHGAESIVVLYWDLKKKRHHYYCPPQKVNSWNLNYPELPTFTGQGVDVDDAGPYKLGRVKLPPMCTLVGTIHSHSDMDVDFSGTDEKDEKFTDGLHIIVGHLRNKGAPAFAAALIVESRRFEVKDDYMEEFLEKDEKFPKSWTDKVSAGSSGGWCFDDLYDKKGKKGKMGFQQGTRGEEPTGGVEITEFDDEGDAQSNLF